MLSSSLKRSPFCSSWAIFSKSSACAMRTSELRMLDHQGHDQQRNDVDDLDERIDRWTGRVLVRIADGVAGDRGLVSIRSLAAVVAVLDVFLGVVPGPSSGAHRDGHEETGHDGPHQY